MKKSNFELATRCGGVQIKGGSINFDMAGLDSFADALLKQELDGQEAVAYRYRLSPNNAWSYTDSDYYKGMHPELTWLPLFTRSPITSEYVVRRHSIYQNRMRLQVSGELITEEEFNIEYDAALNMMRRVKEK